MQNGGLASAPRPQDPHFRKKIFPLLSGDEKEASD